jgi:hypothetical protein
MLPSETPVKSATTLFAPADTVAGVDKNTTTTGLGTDAKGTAVMSKLLGGAAPTRDACHPVLAGSDAQNRTPSMSHCELVASYSVSSHEAPPTTSSFRCRRYTAANGLSPELGTVNTTLLALYTAVIDDTAELAAVMYGQ